MLNTFWSNKKIIEILVYFLDILATVFQSFPWEVYNFFLYITKTLIKFKKKNN